MGRSIGTVEDYFEALPDFYKQFYPALDLTTVVQVQTLQPKGKWGYSVSPV